MRSLTVAAAVAAALAVPATASAAPSSTVSASEVSASEGSAAWVPPGSDVPVSGYDVSHPQCGAGLPAGQSFAVVGIDGGLATAPNPCLDDELAWAQRSSGALAAQPRIQLYLNTANPGQVRDEVSTWPTSGRTPHGDCDGTDSRACAWQYGWERAQDSVTGYFLPAADDAGIGQRAAAYTWWLDVETTNSWESGSSAAQGRNRAALEGMTAYLGSLGADVGIYSTSAQWREIAGTVDAGSSLYGLPSWLAGGSSTADARDACADPPLVPGGRVVMVQYVDDDIDVDVSCG